MDMEYDLAKCAVAEEVKRNNPMHAMLSIAGLLTQIKITSDMCGRPEYEKALNLLTAAEALLGFKDQISSPEQPQTNSASPLANLEDRKINLNARKHVEKTRSSRIGLRSSVREESCVQEILEVIILFYRSKLCSYVTTSTSSTHPKIIKGLHVGLSKKLVSVFQDILGIAGVSTLDKHLETEFLALIEANNEHLFSQVKSVLKLIDNEKRHYNASMEFTIASKKTKQTYMVLKAHENLLQECKLRLIESIRQQISDDEPIHDHVSALYSRIFKASKCYFSEETQFNRNIKAQANEEFETFTEARISHATERLQLTEAPYKVVNICKDDVIQFFKQLVCTDTDNKTSPCITTFFKVNTSLVQDLIKVFQEIFVTDETDALEKGLKRILVSAVAERNEIYLSQMKIVQKLINEQKQIYTTAMAVLLSSTKTNSSGTFVQDHKKLLYQCKKDLSKRIQDSVSENEPLHEHLLEFDHYANNVSKMALEGYKNNPCLKNLSDKLKITTPDVHNKAEPKLKELPGEETDFNFPGDTHFAWSSENLHEHQSGKFAILVLRYFQILILCYIFLLVGIRYSTINTNETICAGNWTMDQVLKAQFKSTCSFLFELDLSTGQTVLSKLPFNFDWRHASK